MLAVFPPGNLNPGELLDRSVKRGVDDRNQSGLLVRGKRRDCFCQFRNNGGMSTGLRSVVKIQIGIVHMKSPQVSDQSHS